MGKLLCAALLVSALAAWPASAQQAPSYSDFVEGSTSFALRFFRQAAVSESTHNVLIAPTAMALDFALLQNGADDGARQEIAGIFGFGELPPRAMNQQARALRATFTKAYAPSPQRRSQAWHSLPRERLQLAGSLWVRAQADFRAPFLNENRTYYGYTLAKLPESDGLAVAAVNRWAARHTAGRLAHLADSVRNDGFLLLDATVFHGNWMRPFDQTRTHSGDFTLASGQKKSVPMMVADDEIPYLRGKNFQAVQLEYGHAAMYVFLPDRDTTLAEFERSLTPENWHAWLRQMSQQEGHLEFPRFQSESRAEVTGALQNLGLVHLFTSFRALAPAVSNPEGARLTRVLQAVSISVDEKGTDAVSAEVAAGVIGGVSAQPPPPFRMLVDRPFFFAICDNQSEAVLYMGAIVDP